MAPSKTALSAEELDTLLLDRPEWSLHDGKLVQEWTFKDFLGAMQFVERVAVMAEKAQHHPDIDIRYNKVKLSLISHDAGGITARDARMAAQLSAEFSASSPA